MTLGAPLTNSNAEPGDASSESTTIPDLRVSGLNSSTLSMLSFPCLEAERLSGLRGSTTVSRSCMEVIIMYKLQNVVVSYLHVVRVNELLSVLDMIQ